MSSTLAPKDSHPCPDINPTQSNPNSIHNRTSWYYIKSWHIILCHIRWDNVSWDGNFKMIESRFKTKPATFLLQFGQPIFWQKVSILKPLKMFFLSILYHPLCSSTHLGQVGRYCSELVFRKPSAPFSKRASRTWETTMSICETTCFIHISRDN